MHGRYMCITPKKNRCGATFQKDDKGTMVAAEDHKGYRGGPLGKFLKRDCFACEGLRQLRMRQSLVSDWLTRIVNVAACITHSSTSIDHPAVDKSTLNDGAVVPISIALLSVSTITTACRCLLLGG